MSQRASKAVWYWISEISVGRESPSVIRVVPLLTLSPIFTLIFTTFPLVCGEIDAF